MLQRINYRSFMYAHTRNMLLSSVRIVFQATLSGMKVLTTVLAHDEIEDCRKCCGGQGFLKAGMSPPWH